MVIQKSINNQFQKGRCFSAKRFEPQRGLKLSLMSSSSVLGLRLKCMGKIKGDIRFFGNPARRARPLSMTHDRKNEKGTGTEYGASPFF